MKIAHCLTAEFIGTTLLLSSIVGSGIMGERLSGGNNAVALLANSLATGGMLIVIILIFGNISGAHFNPAVTIMSAVQGRVKWYKALAYIIVQLIGAFAGVASAHLMFSEPVFSVSQNIRAGNSQLFSEFIATFGLIAVVWGCSRLRLSEAAFAIAAYIISAYWFTSSTSFANPAVTLARIASNTFSGIRPEDAFGFIVAQILGLIVAILLFRWLIPLKNL
jgi:glycerol uptake facilitator-like aquaporin